MGYYMRLVKEHFFIPRENHTDALNAIKNLLGKETIKIGRKPHYSFVHHDFLKKNLVETLEAWRWPPILDEEYNIVGIKFSGEKLGDENLLFDTIGPYVEAGSYIEMMGEDGSLWRWVFDGEKCEEIDPEISWEVKR